MLNQLECPQCLSIMGVILLDDFSLSLQCDCKYSAKISLQDFFKENENNFTCDNETHGRKAIKYCVSCQRWICIECFEQHKVHFLSDYRINKKQFVCKYHPHRKIKYYCVGCDKKICSICKAGFFEYNEKIEIQQNKVIQNFDTINISNGIITPFTSVADTSDNKEVRNYHQFKDIELEKLKSQDHDLLQQFEEVSNKIIKYLPNKTNKREFIQFQKENEPIRDKIKERNDTIEYVLMNVLLYKFLSLMKNLYLTTKHLNICNVLLNFKRNFRINPYYISNTNNSLSKYLVPQNMVITLEQLTTYEAEKEIKVILLLKTGKKVIIILEFLFVYAKI